MGSNKYIITKIKCWPSFKQDPSSHPTGRRLVHPVSGLPGLEGPPLAPPARRYDSNALNREGHTN